MIINSIKTFMPYLATGLLTLTACSRTLDNTKKYFENKPVTEYEQFISSNNAPYVQSKLDSSVYRDFFNSTKFSNDSSAVKDFNKIAASMRGYKPENFDRKSIRGHIRESVRNAGITTKDFEEFKCNIIDETLTTTTKLQHKADQWAYKRFFEKIGLMENDSLANKFEKISNIYNPSI